MPFTIQVPFEAVPSLEVSPIEKSLFDVVYFLEVQI